MPDPPSANSEGGSIAGRVRRYIDRRPVVRSALAKGIVNLSELTRQIIDVTGIDQKHAILAACRRYQGDLEAGTYGSGVRSLLAGMRLEVCTRISTITVPRSSDHGLLTEIGGRRRKEETQLHVAEDGIRRTFILNEDVARELVQTIDDHDLVGYQANLVTANLRFPKPIEDADGLLAYLTTNLWHRGVSPRNTVSGHKGVVLVLDQSGLATAVEVLEGLVDR